MSINSRIDELISKFYSGNKSAFAKAIGVSSSVIENIVGKRKTNPSFDVTIKIYSAIENLNPDWLLLGNGRILRSPDDSESDSAISEIQTGYGPVLTKVARPFISAENEYLCRPDAFSNAVNSGECELVVIPFIGDYDFSLFVQGNSMVNTEEPEKSIPAGSLAACRLWSDPSFIRWGEIYALATTKGYVIKRIFQSETEGYVSCESTNKRGRYKSFDLPLDEILDWAIVVGSGTFKVW